MSSLGERLARAIGAKDPDAVRAVLDPAVDFRALTPGRTWDADTADGVLSVLFEHWFEDTDHVTDVLAVSAGDPVADTEHVAYRFALRNGDGDHVLEQQAYYRHDGDRVTYLRVLCSGYRPAASPPA